MHLVTGVINAVVVDVQHIITLEQLPAIFPVELHKILRLDGLAPFIQGSL